MLDILTIGESMLRLTPPPPLALEQTPSFEVRVGGSEMNLAITASRMGRRAGWITKLPRGPLGRRVVRAAQEHGVDATRVVWADEGRVGIYYIDSGEPPRGRNTLYDRAGSAFTALSPEEVDWDYLQEAKILHFSGITLALGELPRQVVLQAVDRAQADRQWVSFDLNYRAKLWSPGEAQTAIAPLLSEVDILCAGRQDAQDVLGLTGEAPEIAQTLFERYGPKVAVVTDEAHLAAAFDGELHTSAPRPVQVVDRIGAGDAFMAGFLVGYLEGGTKQGLEMATALGALKLTYLGDIAWCTRSEVIDFMEERNTPAR